MALSEMRNEVADWLPSDFLETSELAWFKEHFLGSQFVILSWDGCSTADDRYKAMLAKMRLDCADTPVEGLDAEARRLGDRLGLHATDELHEDWSSGRERWLIGDGDQWYYVTSDGGLYRWKGGQNLVGWVSRGIERWRTGTNAVEGELVHQFRGADAEAIYRNPAKLSSRLFKQVITGPEIFEQLAGPEGSLIRGAYDPRDPDVLEAQIEAHRRLTGLFFGPTPARDFDWTAKSFYASLPEATRSALPDAWEPFFNEFVARTIREKYQGDRAAFLAAGDGERLEHWYRLFYELQVEAPPRPTCLVAALSEVASRDLSRVVGRPDFFKPVGRIYSLAMSSGVAPEQLHLGGPPVDNVAIDEEGTITLFNLVSLSTAIGLTIAYLSFRSIGVTLMIFFVGGTAAVCSLGFVWFGGSSLDAVLLSMPSLVYVLGLSGAVHIVNYYREECHESGQEGAAERAVSHGWFACFLAAFTTALGLVSLVSANLVPIQKFGLYSAIGTMATLALLFAFLPSALTLWPPKYRRITPQERASQKPGFVFRFWDAFGLYVVRYHRLVIVATVGVFAFFTYGMMRIETSVQLLKLFDSSSKVIGDYRWLESNLGRLVPMELVLAVDPEMCAESDRPLTGSEGESPELLAERRLTFLERMEMSARVRKVVEREFGEAGRNIVGPGMSTDVMILPPTLPAVDSGLDRTRSVFNQALLENRERLDEELDFFRIDRVDERELWRISLRLGAFNDVDYGRFVSDLQQAVEPVLAAYRHRDRILRSLHSAATTENRVATEQLKTAGVLLLGWADLKEPAAQAGVLVGQAADAEPIDQTAIFCETLRELLENRGFQFSQRGRGRTAYALNLSNPQHAALLADGGALYERLDRFSCVVLVQRPEPEVVARLAAAEVPIVDCTDHRVEVNPQTKELSSPSAAMRLRELASVEDGSDLATVSRTRETADGVFVSAVYTGIVPIVYKAQRTLLTSLTDSIISSFWMIAAVMMILLRDWRRPPGLFNWLNITGGLVSMIPNVLPIIVIFGAMGWLNLEVDIGSMMTASVALGVAVDDTIHFLAWFRAGMRGGLDRQTAIRTAYARVATAMTQTTLIAGLGLAAFAFSTFTPTQRFGVLMLTLLLVALIGDLILLPALLASRLGKLLEVVPYLPPGTPPVLGHAETSESIETRGAATVADRGVQEITHGGAPAGGSRASRIDESARDALLDRPHVLRRGRSEQGEASS